jgi:hypothetical protein
MQSHRRKRQESDNSLREPDQKKPKNENKPSATEVSFTKLKN